MTEDSTFTMLHYGLLGMVAVNMILNILTFDGVNRNRSIAITAEAFAKIAAEDRITPNDLKKMLDVRDAQIRELQDRLDNLDKTQ